MNAQIKILKSEKENLKTRQHKLTDENSELKKLNEKQKRETKIAVQQIKKVKQRFEVFEKKVEAFRKNTSTIEKYKEMVENEKNEMEKTLLEYKQQLIDMENDFSFELNKINEEINIKNSEIIELKNNQIAFYDEKILFEKQINQDKIEYERKIMELERLKEEMNSIRLSHDEQRRKLYNEIEDLKTEVQELEKEKENFKENAHNVSVVESQKLELDEQIANLTLSNHQKEKELEEMKIAMDKTEQDKQNMQQNTDRLQNENSLLSEDVKNAYFLTARLRQLVIEIETDKFQALSDKEMAIQSLEKLSFDLEQIKLERNDLVNKNMIFHESKETFQTLTEKLTELIDKKEHEYKKMLKEKELIIDQLKKQLELYTEKVQTVQKEKEDLFKNFHELALKSYHKDTNSESKQVSIIKDNNVISTDLYGNEVSKPEKVKEPVQNGQAIKQLESILKTSRKRKSNKIEEPLNSLTKKTVRFSNIVPEENGHSTEDTPQKNSRDIIGFDMSSVKFKPDKSVSWIDDL